MPRPHLQIPEKLNPFVTVCAEEARAQATEVDAARAAGKSLGPLAGVPVSVKDILNTKGVRTVWGSRLMENNVPAEDAVAVKRLKDAGAVIIGKTTTPEFAYKLLTDSPISGITRNPWNAELTPGGSSGGSAVAVAAGMGPLSLATDAGASTRLPAACCGILGLKPTLGRVPHSQVPDAFNNFIHLGVMARTVADCELMLEAIAGPHPSDPYSLFSPQRKSERLRIERHPLLGNTLLDDEVLEQCEAALAVIFLSSFGGWMNLSRMPKLHGACCSSPTGRHATSRSWLKWSRRSSPASPPASARAGRTRGSSSSRRR